MRAIAFFILLAVMLQLGHAGSGYCVAKTKSECENKCQKWSDKYGLDQHIKRKCVELWCDGCPKEFVRHHNDGCNRLQDCPKKSDTTRPTQKDG
ncbi:unnamed protein product [Caenorhabditis brenneri]